MKKLQYQVWSRKNRKLNHLDFVFSVFDEPFAVPANGVTKLREPSVDPSSTIPAGHSYQFVLKLTLQAGAEIYVLNSNNNFTIKTSYSIMNDVLKAEIVEQSGSFRTEVKVDGVELEIDFPWESEPLWFVTTPPTTYLRIEF